MTKRQLQYSSLPILKDQLGLSKLPKCKRKGLIIQFQFPSKKIRKRKKISVAIQERSTSVGKLGSLPDFLNVK